MAARQGALPKARGDARPTALAGVRGQHSQAAHPLELDRLIHERVRLGIVSALAVNGSLTFTDLKELLGATDGNLSAHARRLEDAGYVRCQKSFESRMPKTEYELTKLGRRELQLYLDHMEAIISATRDA